MSGAELMRPLSSPKDEVRHEQAWDGSVGALEIPASHVLTPLQTCQTEKYHLLHKVL